MSVMNYDRHGMDSLKHDKVKALDRVKIPPVLIFGVAGLTIASIYSQFQGDKEMDTEALLKKNTLLAMKSEQNKMLYRKDEVTAAEQITMDTTQYKQVVKQQQKKEEKKLKQIKRVVLATTSVPKTDINNLSNS